MGTLPKYPFVIPSMADSTIAHSSPDSAGLSRGVAHNIVSGTRTTLASEQSANLPRGQSYGTEAMTCAA